MRMIRNKSGLSLAELMVTIFVLAISLTGTLLFFTNARVAQQYARDTTTAVSHTEHILEEMMARTTLANITSTNWVAWASAQSLNTLPTETITVVHTNSSSDPLETTVTVSWLRNARTYVYSILTRMTK